MSNAIFFNHIKENKLNSQIIKRIESYSKRHDNTIIYLINSALGEKNVYAYQEQAIVILSPGHKLIFIYLDNNEEEATNYTEDFISDLEAISKKYGYQEYIGRARTWRDELTCSYYANNDAFDIENILKNEETQIADKDTKRKCELIISLLTGCINDIKKIGIKQPGSLLEQVKKKIILFDAEQTRFIYRQYAVKKVVSVQGLSGTGKTELLLHKLKELYSENDSNKIFFTCHNIALSRKIRQRIPPFFDMMKVDKQIKWNERLWMVHAWGSHLNANSGLYSYLCNYYQLPFHRFSRATSYKQIFSEVLNLLNQYQNFQPCFDYILVDESQDFPDEFFDVCKKVVRHKVYVAGDIFQDIFETVKKTSRGFDIFLNRCYRTDPRTLMFAHSVGLGLFEDKKFNWFENEEWKRLGYSVQEIKSERKIQLYRNPIRRFDNENLESSVIIKNDTNPNAVIKIIKDLRNENENLIPGDIAIIILDDSREIYTYIDQLAQKINLELKWSILRGYESKGTKDDSVYITNPNNVKGLEFPYVICVTNKILDTYKYRNTLYTMLTRSFIQSFLMVTQNYKLDIFEDGLKFINLNHYIETSKPSEEDMQQIHQTILDYQGEEELSYDEFIEQIFNDLEIQNSAVRSKIKNTLLGTTIDKFDKERIIEFIKYNIPFFL